jgi:glycine cleavage system aminomethyltransferase T
MTSALACFALVGPWLDEFLRRLTELTPAINFCAETAFAGVEALLVRPGACALPTLWVYVAWELGEYVWERIIEAGRDIPVTAIGLDALGQL